MPPAGVHMDAAEGNCGEEADDVSAVPDDLTGEILTTSGREADQAA